MPKTEILKTSTDKTTKPTEQEIRECAYKLWEKAGKPEGEEKTFWAQAEKELS